jgi:hypothetical protein
MSAPDTKTRRGDAILIERTESITYAFGSGRGTERKKLYAIAIVTSVTREGRMKGAERPSDIAPWPWKFGGGQEQSWVIVKGERCLDPVELVRRIYADREEDFDSFEAARDAIKAECLRQNEDARKAA